MAPDGEIGRVWSLRRPMTYRALTSLQKLGLAEVDSIESSSTPPPNRTLLRATPDAQALVEQWLITPEPHVRDLRSLLLLKIHFLQPPRPRAGAAAAPAARASGGADRGARRARRPR